MTAATVADQAIRDRALDIRHSFAVSAPAGSGKTGLLVRRILKLLATCESPEQVLAITFTRKAAAEMQERIVKALNTARSDTPPQDDYEKAIWQDARQVLKRDEEEGWNLVASPSRLRLMTIDSLCRHVARQMAIETALGDLPEPTDQPGVFYREAIRELFKHLEQPGPFGDALALLLEHLDNNLASLENLLESLLAKREQWLKPLKESQDERGYLEKSLENTVEETLTDLGEALTLHGSDLALLADYAAANLENSGNAIRTLAGIAGLPDTEPSEENLNQWLALSELLLTKSDSWRSPKGITKREGFPSAKSSDAPENAAERKQQLIDLLEILTPDDGLLQLLIDLRKLPGIAYSDSQWQLLDALTNILPLLVAELSLLFKSRHTCDFTEVTLAALEALGNEEDVTDVSLKLDYQIQHILVDEFQDTSFIQSKLLKSLTRGWHPDDGRTLFVVGDGMQSLYGFRNANVGIFLEARHLPLGDIQLEPLDLQVNFRSDPAVVGWVNNCFSGIFPQREDISRGAVQYASATAARESKADSGVSVEIFDPDADPLDEARRVIALIEDARSIDPDGSVAILVRARSHLRAIIPALHEQGIPWEATDIDPLATRMPVIDLHSITRALLNPADRIAWLAVLRAPWCGLSLNDLHTLATAGAVADGKVDELPWLGGQLFSNVVQSSLSEDGKQRLSRVSDVLRSSWQQRFRKPLRQWVEGTWLALGGPATLLNHHEMAWCRQYLDLLEANSVGSSLEDMDRFATSLDNLYASPLESAGNPVQIMTIHKSKGLEFDTVILPSLHKGGGSANSELLYWRERINAQGDPELLISPLLSPNESPDEMESRLVSHLKYEAKRKSALEDDRVLYVACTRAIKRLHLLYQEPNRNPTSGSLLSCFWNARELSEQAGAAHRNHAASAESEEEVVRDRLGFISRLASGWQNPCTARSSTEISLDEEREKSSTNDEFAGDDRARHMGTVLHRTLKQIVVDGIAHWDAERIERQKPVWKIQLQQLGLSDTETEIDTLHRAVSTMVADKTGQWLLANTHDQSACELAIGHRDGDQASISVIDRTFVEDDVRWIVDYKSSQPQPGESVEAFARREARNYGDQLARYRSVFTRREAEREIRTALYFPLVGHLEVVDFGSDV